MLNIVASREGSRVSSSSSRAGLPGRRLASGLGLRLVFGLVPGLVLGLFWGLVPGLGAGPALASDLAAFLERAERMGTANDKVEADLTIREADGTTRTGHLLIDPAGGGRLVYEDKATGWKSESPLAWKDGTATPKTGAPAQPLPPDAPIAGTDLRAIDFFPFWKTDYTKAFTSDENTNERTVSLYAEKGRPYSLYVITFDKTHLVPQMIKYYRDTFNNLVRTRTDKGWKMVGSRPRATEMVVKDFGGNTVRTYLVGWRGVGE